MGGWVVAVAPGPWLQVPSHLGCAPPHPTPWAPSKKEHAQEESQKYKEGKVIVERAKVSSPQLPRSRFCGPSRLLPTLSPMPSPPCRLYIPGAEGG